MKEEKLVKKSLKKKSVKEKKWLKKRNKEGFIFFNLKEKK